MYIFINAIQNLGRNKGRNILMGIIILAVVATCAISLIINNTAGGIIDEYKTRFASEVFISLNGQALQNNGGGKGVSESGNDPAEQYRITREQHIAFAESDYLKETIFTTTVQAKSTNELRAVGIPNSEADLSEGQWASSLKLLGTNDFPEFVSGEREIVDGGWFENENECLVSQELAERNNISIGDVIRFEAGGEIVPGVSDGVEGSYALIVSGIYADYTPEYDPMLGPKMETPINNRRNEILASFETVANDNIKNVGINVRYFLRNPDMLENFKAEIISKGLPVDYYNIRIDDSDYNKIVKPVIGLKSITLTFIIVVLTLGAIILILMSTIAMRERKYEIGVLRAMGMKKKKVTLGLISEMLMITIICLVLGLGVGIAAAQPVSDMLLKGQVEAVTTDDGNSVQAAYRNPNAGRADRTSTAESLSEMDVNFGWNIIWQIIGISLMLAAVASIVGVSQVTKFEPMKILSERT